MPRTLKQIISFIEHYSIDERVFIKVPRYDQATEYIEVIWERGASDKPWKIRAPKSLSWHYCSSEDAVHFLKEESADMRFFEQGLTDAVVSQAIYADYYVRQAEDVIGAEKIEEAKRKTDSFLANLTKILHRKKVHSKDRAIAPTLGSHKRSTQHLKLIRPEDRRQN